AGSIYSLYTLSAMSWVFFFFQAEDGIRDSSVTGVQTCALPICQCVQDRAEVNFVSWESGLVTKLTSARSWTHWRVPEQRSRSAEIGRASCRARVEIWGVGVAFGGMGVAEEGDAAGCVATERRRW